MISGSIFSVDTNAAASSREWPDPDFAVLRLSRRAPPVLPLQVFGPQWTRWIASAAKAASCPADYVAGTLLACASALIGNARWAQVREGWAEPPVLWCALVGESGGGKSPGADTLMRQVLPTLQRRARADYPDRLAEWQLAHQSHVAAQRIWKSAVREATKNGDPLPPAPPEPAPERPQEPEIFMNDATPPKVAAVIAHASPKGVLIVRDELPGWLLSLNSFGGGGRAFWVETYGGRVHRLARQSLQNPIEVPRLTCAVLGSVQPEKLASVLKGADDGLLPRFCWFWPDEVPFSLSEATSAVAWATEALDRLRLLELDTSSLDGSARPRMVSLAEPAISEMERFGRDMQQQQARSGGLLRPTYGKARGVALRLALVLEYLWWCARDGIASPPSTISQEALAAAITLSSQYLIPMAERVYGDATVSEQERGAATLACWIVAEQAEEVHVRTLQRRVRLPGLADAGSIHAAAQVLIEADWLASPAKGVGHRGRQAYRVNPKVLERHTSGPGDNYDSCDTRGSVNTSGTRGGSTSNASAAVGKLLRTLQLGGDKPAAEGEC